MHVSTDRLLSRLVAQAGLPPVLRSDAFDGGALGLDNSLTRAVLADGREVLLRVNPAQPLAPDRRALFLAACGVGAPTFHAADGNGASLVDFIPGLPLADLVVAGEDTAEIWERTGAAFARVHAVRFPAPLQGTVGPLSIQLSPCDPVEDLLASLDRSRSWVGRHKPHLFVAWATLRLLIRGHAHRVRAETPCLVHGDANLLNVIVGPGGVTLIDWDFPAVRYPLAELSALDEHVYLSGGEGLPDPFFRGYGAAVPRDLLLLYRMVGCLQWLSGDDWPSWDRDTALPPPARRRIREWHRRLLDWADQIPDLCRGLERAPGPGQEGPTEGHHPDPQQSLP
nr:phosphotransferase [uncultured Friedmanniella sp.]